MDKLLSLIWRLLREFFASQVIAGLIVGLFTGLVIAGVPVVRYFFFEKDPDILSYYIFFALVFAAFGMCVGLIIRISKVIRTHHVSASFGALIGALLCFWSVHYIFYLFYSDYIFRYLEPIMFSIYSMEEARSLTRAVIFYDLLYYINSCSIQGACDIVSALVLDELFWGAIMGFGFGLLGIIIIGKGGISARIVNFVLICIMVGALTGVVVEGDVDNYLLLCIMSIIIGSLVGAEYGAAFCRRELTVVNMLIVFVCAISLAIRGAMYGFFTGTAVGIIVGITLSNNDIASFGNTYYFSLKLFIISFSAFSYLIGCHYYSQKGPASRIMFGVAFCAILVTCAGVVLAILLAMFGFGNHFTSFILFGPIWGAILGSCSPSKFWNVILTSQAPNDDDTFPTGSYWLGVILGGFIMYLSDPDYKISILICMLVTGMIFGFFASWRRDFSGIYLSVKSRTKIISAVKAIIEQLRQ